MPRPAARDSLALLRPVACDSIRDAANGLVGFPYALSYGTEMPSTNSGSSISAVM